MSLCTAACATPSGTTAVPGTWRPARTAAVLGPETWAEAVCHLQAEAMTSHVHASHGGRMR